MRNRPHYATITLTTTREDRARGIDPDIDVELNLEAADLEGVDAEDIEDMNDVQQVLRISLGSVIGIVTEIFDSIFGDDDNGGGGGGGGGNGGGGGGARVTVTIIQ